MQSNRPPQSRRRNRQRAGFTSLQKYVWRAQRNEAYLNLNGIYKAQLTYFTNTGSYADNFGDLGFEILGGTALDPKTIQSKYYTYTLSAFANTAGLENGNYQAVATGDPDPGDAILDILMIENDLIIVD